MADVMTADALNAALQQIDDTAGFTVEFAGTGFNAWNSHDKKFRGSFSTDPAVNYQTFQRVVEALRWPPGTPAEVKDRPFKGPAKTPREKFMETMLKVERLGKADARTLTAQLEQRAFDLTGLNITYEPTLIGPKEAKEFLLTFGGLEKDGKPAQRNFSQLRMKKYVEQMIIPGAWYLSPDPWAYDLEGMGFNGLHRAMAILYTGLTLPFMVSRGWAREAFLALDKGLTRTSSTSLFLSGEKHATHLDRAATLLHKIEKLSLISAWSDNKDMRPEEARKLQLVHERPALREAVAWARSGVPKVMHNTALAVCYALAAEACGDGVVGEVVTYDMNPPAKYFNSLKYGDGLNFKDPAHTVRKHIETDGKSEGGYVRQSVFLPREAFHAYLFLTGWNRWVMQEEWPSVMYKAKDVTIPKALRPATLPRLGQ